MFVAVLLGAATTFAAAIRLTERIAINPWEPAIAMEAMRFNAGLQLYDAAHATHMYGPLLTVLLGGIFHVTGLNLLAARIVISIFALALTIFLALAFSRGISWEWITFAVLLFLGVNFRTNLALLSAQPDCVAVLIACLGLLVWTKSSDSTAARIGSSLLFVCAMLFKQTAAAFALLPITFVLMWQRPLILRELLISAVPPISVFLTLAVVRLIAPGMFHAMVTVPGSIQVRWGLFPRVFLYLMATFPLFVVGLVAVFSKQRPLDHSERWVLSALVLLIPVSIWAICKSGGSYNSLLPAYFAMTALFVSRLDVIIAWLDKLPPLRATLASSGIALVIILSFFAQLDRSYVVLSLRQGDDKYDAAVAAARASSGTVISPQDPTIAYRAKGYFGNSLAFELDTHAVNGNWPAELPESLSHELATANSVIQVKSFVPNPMLERALINKGFSPLSIEALAGSAYTVWTKKSE